MSTALVDLIIMVCTDEKGDSWTIVDPKDVPEHIKTPEVIEFLEAGCVAQLPGESDLYVGIKNGTGGQPNQLSTSIQLVNVYGDAIH